MKKKTLLGLRAFVAALSAMSLQSAQAIPDASPQPATPAPAGVLAPQELLTASLSKLLDVLSPAPNAPRQTFSTQIKILKAQGLLPKLAGQSASIALESPDRLKVQAEFMGQNLFAGRNGQQVWFYSPEKKWGVVGKSGVPLFNAAPSRPAAQ